MDSLTRLSQSIDQAVAQISGLRREAENSRQELKRAQAQLKEKEDMLEALRARFEGALDELNQARAGGESAAELEGRVRRAEEEASQYLEDLQEVRLQARKEREGFEAQARAMKDALQQALDKAQERDSEPLLRGRLAQAEERAEALKEELAQALDRLAGAPQASELEALRLHVAELRRRCQELEARAPGEAGQALEQEAAALRRRQKGLEKWRRERGQVRRRLEEILSQLENLRLG